VSDPRSYDERRDAAEPIVGKLLECLGEDLQSDPAAVVNALATTLSMAIGCAAYLNGETLEEMQEGVEACVANLAATLVEASLQHLGGAVELHRRAKRQPVRRK
jgi:hypothetical protein